jgi:hypothetical protein
MADTMSLARDLLDAQLVDRNQRRIGRVDGVIIEIRAGVPPRVAAMEVGFLTAARRIHRRLPRILRRILKRLPVAPATVRLPLTLCREVGVNIALDLDASEDRRLLRVERWLRRHVVARIPTASK